MFMLVAIEFYFRASKYRQHCKVDFASKETKYNITVRHTFKSVITHDSTIFHELQISLAKTFFLERFK